MLKQIRIADISDLAGVIKCVNDAKKFLKDSGSTQWNGKDGYPQEADLIADIQEKRLFVCVRNYKIAGIAAFLGEEPEYQKPFGTWLTDTNQYLTIHRIAVNDDFRGQGVAKALFKYAEAYAKKKHKVSIRVDTHEKNKAMQGLAEKMGYTLCGYVLYRRISEEPKRLIYEKVLR